MWGGFDDDDEKASANSDGAGWADFEDGTAGDSGIAMQRDAVEGKLRKEAGAQETPVFTRDQLLEESDEEDGFGDFGGDARASGDEKVDEWKTGFEQEDEEVKG